MKPLDERSHTFIVKIWEERRDVAGVAPTWRSSVDDVQGGGRVYFTTLRELSDHLRRRSGMAASLPRLRERLLARLRRR